MWFEFVEELFCTVGALTRTCSHLKGISFLNFLRINFGLWNKLRYCPYMYIACVKILFEIVILWFLSHVYFPKNDVLFYLGSWQKIEMPWHYKDFSCLLHTFTYLLSCTWLQTTTKIIKLNYSIYHYIVWIIKLFKISIQNISISLKSNMKCQNHYFQFSKKFLIYVKIKYIKNVNHSLFESYDV